MTPPLLGNNFKPWGEYNVSEHGFKSRKHCIHPKDWRYRAFVVTETPLPNYIKILWWLNDNARGYWKSWHIMSARPGGDNRVTFGIKFTRPSDAVKLKLTLGPFEELKGTSSALLVPFEGASNDS